MVGRAVGYVPGAGGNKNQRFAQSRALAQTMSWL
jgi:hypothetical protein